MNKGLTIGVLVTLTIFISGTIWNASSVDSQVKANKVETAKHAAYEKLHTEFKLDTQRLQIMVGLLLKHQGIPLPPQAK